MSVTAFTALRRADLIKWLRERDQHNGLTAREIADVSGIYSGHGMADRCFDDLNVLHKQGVVLREGRPARWSLMWTEALK
jgi:hypothetical protein